MGTDASQPDPQGTDATVSADLVACVHTATLAPSIHNTQPWQFHIRDNGIDVYADWRRRLDIIDPNGRQLIISVGAAIMNLRLAIYQRGWASACGCTAGPEESRPVAAGGSSWPRRRGPRAG